MLREAPARLRQTAIAQLAREMGLWYMAREALPALLAEYERVTGRPIPGAKPDDVRAMIRGILDAEFPPRA